MGALGFAIAKILSDISSVLQPNSPQAMVQTALQSASKTKLVRLFLIPLTCPCRDNLNFSLPVVSSSPSVNQTGTTWSSRTSLASSLLKTKPMQPSHYSTEMVMAMSRSKRSNNLARSSRFCFPTSFVSYRTSQRDPPGTVVNRAFLERPR